MHEKRCFRKVDCIRAAKASKFPKGRLFANAATLVQHPLRFSFFSGLTSNSVLKNSRGSSSQRISRSQGMPAKASPERNTLTSTVRVSGRGYPSDSRSFRKRDFAGTLSEHRHSPVAEKPEGHFPTQV
jgi:hypothetical protein